MTDSDDDIEAQAEKLVGDVWVEHGQWLGEPESLAAIVVALRAEHEQGRERGREQGLREAAEAVKTCGNGSYELWEPGETGYRIARDDAYKAILALIPSPQKEPSP